MKAETEMAMKLLEKDIHVKQDTIISLRQQLDDIKLINLEMYTKLQVINGFTPSLFSVFVFIQIILVYARWLCSTKLHTNKVSFSSSLNKQHKRFNTLYRNVR